MMTTSQIRRALLKHPVARKYFAGVFASDRIPSKVPFYPCCMVWNTDSADKPGEHWVCVFVKDKNSKIDYFDSYGLPPPLATFRLFLSRASGALTYNYNHVTFQGLTSTVCGHYCLYFLGLKCRGWSMTRILNSFPSRKLGGSDVSVYNIVKRAYGL